MKRMIMAALAVAVVGMTAGCWTPRQVERCRVNRQRSEVVKLQASGNTVFAGIDVYGLKEAIQDDPCGTAAALGKDGILAALGAAAVAYVANEIDGEDDKSAKAKTPQSSPGVAVNGTDNSLTVPSTVVSGPIIIGGQGNNVSVFEPEPATVAP
jgi:hypothetical protein